MAEVGRWGNHRFFVEPTQVHSFSGLSVKGSAETEETEDGGQKYTSRKISKPVDVSLTIKLNSRMGAPVRDEAIKFVEEAQNGVTDYFYIGNRKLMTCQFMLTAADVSNIRMTNTGAWYEAEIKLTLKQASQEDGIVPGSSTSSGGSSGGGGGGGGGGSDGGGGGEYYGGDGSSKISVQPSDPVVMQGAAKAIGAGFAVGGPIAATIAAAGAGLAVAGSKLADSVGSWVKDTITKQDTTAAQSKVQYYARKAKTTTAAKKVAGNGRATVM